MNFPLITVSKAPETPSQFAAKPILALFARKQSEIWHFARLLGGYEASRLVDRCAAALEREAALTSRVQIMLDQILSILSLDKAADPDQHFMGYFAVIDQSDPVVGEICVLTDELRSAVAEAAARRRWADARTKDSRPK